MRAVAPLLAVLAFGSGCGHALDDCRNTRTCPPPADAGVVYVVSDAGTPCDGVCAPIGGSSEGWTKEPFLLMRPMPDTAPKNPCPDTAPTLGFQGYAVPDQAFTCPTCACSTPTGLCRLPESVTAGVSPECSVDASVPFNPPTDWDGGCTTHEALADSTCDGGVCTQSVIVGTMGLEEHCEPIPSTVPKDVTWAQSAYTCEGEAHGTCDDAGDACVPSPPDGYDLCVSREGDDDFFKCPTAYPRRYVFCLSADDSRACTPCTCDEPEGSTCSSLVSYYSDDACAEPVGAVTATTSASICGGVPPGTPLGSKQASSPVYTPGSCKPSGGEVVGTVQPTYPFTFCCRE